VGGQSRAAAVFLWVGVCLVDVCWSVLPSLLRDALAAWTLT
jgi:hypothetical protein